MRAVPISRTGRGNGRVALRVTVEVKPALEADGYHGGDVPDEELRRAATGLLIIEHTGSSLILRWRWLGRRIVNGLLAAGPATWLLVDLRMWRSPVNILSVIFWTIAIVGWHLTAAHLVNQTRVTIDATRLVVVHGPLWWPGAGRWPVEEIQKLFVHETVYGRRGRRQHDYTVRMQSSDGKEVDIVHGPLDWRRAEAVVATLGCCLRSPDAHDPGRDEMATELL